MAIRGLSPADLDNVESASAPIMPDPRVRAKRWGQPQIDAHVRDTMGASINNDEAQAVLMAQLMEQGIPRDEAMVIAARDMARAHTDSYRGRPTPPSQFERDYNEATGMPARPQVAAPAPQVDADMVPLTPDELRARGQNPFTEPGVNMPDGTSMVRPQAIATEQDARDYNTRIPVTHENAMQAGADAAFLPSPRDRDMMARGFFPVYAPDGSVSYSVGTGPSEMLPSADGRGIPGAPGRLGPRADLQETDPSRPGFVLEKVRGPTGTNYIYKQNDAARAKQAAYMQERQIARMADATGMDETALAAMSPEERRMAVRSSKRSDAQDRMNAWKSQMMLAGRNPAKNMVNAFNAMGDSDLTDQQRSSLRYMLPGGQLAAAVDAKQLDEAAALAQRAVTGALAGGGQTSLAQAQMEQAARDRAVKRADELIARYPRGWDGMYDAADVEAVRTAVNKQHPGLGDAAVAHLPVRPARPPAPGVGGGPTGGAAPLPTAPPPRGDL